MELIELYSQHRILVMIQVRWRLVWLKWTKILATIQSLSMQIHGVVVKKISKKESMWALRWPQNVQYQLYETAKGKQLSKQTLS